VGSDAVDVEACRDGGALHGGPALCSRTADGDCVYFET
jgi:hypothetical protein